MEFSIKISDFDPEKVRWGEARPGPFRRTIPFGYEDHGLIFKSLALTLDPMLVVEIDNERNQLVLEESRKYQFISKLEAFQQSVSSELESNSDKFLDPTKVPPQIRNPLQPWIKLNRITLYLSDKPEFLHFFSESGPLVFSSKTVKPGDMIRAVIKVQGISLQMSEDDIWTGKSRIQHNILQLYKVGPT